MKHKTLVGLWIVALLTLLLTSTSAKEIESEFEFWLNTTSGGVYIDAGDKIEWSKTFGGLNSSAGYSVQLTEDGGYIIAGTTYSYGAGKSDTWLIKTDSEGNEEWSKTFGESSWDAGCSVQQTKNGGYIIVGYMTNSYGAGENDVWLIKTDSKGNEEWNKTFGGAYIDWGESVQHTNDDGYVITGSTKSYGAGEEDVWLIKTDSKGNEKWNKTFGGLDWDEGRSVQQTNDGGYILVGVTWSYGAGGRDVWLIKTDSEGNEEWNETFGGDSADMGWSVQQTEDGGYIIVGEGNYLSIEMEVYFVVKDVWLIKADSKGNEEWDMTLGKRFVDDIGHYVQPTDDGGYIIVGSTGSYDEDVLLIKIGPVFPTKEKPTLTPEFLTTPPTPTPSGFKAIFTIAGLLAVVYLLRKK